MFFFSLFATCCSKPVCFCVSLIGSSFSFLCFSLLLSSFSLFFASSSGFLEIIRLNDSRNGSLEFFFPLYFCASFSCLLESLRLNFSRKDFPKLFFFTFPDCPISVFLASTSSARSVSDISVSDSLSTVGSSATFSFFFIPLSASLFASSSGKLGSDFFRLNFSRNDFAKLFFSPFPDCSGSALELLSTVGFSAFFFFSLPISAFLVASLIACFLDSESSRLNC